MVSRLHMALAARFPGAKCLDLSPTAQQRHGAWKRARTKRFRSLRGAGKCPDIFWIFDALTWLVELNAFSMAQRIGWRPRA